MLRRALATWCLLGACGLGAQACGDGRQPDVLLITVDTLRPDHLGIYGHTRPTSPHLDRWFADGLIFERAYSTDANTPPSVVSILSGKLPPDHGVRLFVQLLPDGQRLIPDLLPASYQTAAFVSSYVLTEEAIGLAGHFGHYDDFVDERESKRVVFERRASRTTDAALAWLRASRDPARPLFFWVHYIDPHGPYDPPAEWTRSFASADDIPVKTSSIPGYQRMEGVDNAQDYVTSYDEEIAYTDAEIGRLLDAASAVVDLDRALLVFSADHGESMLERNVWFNHGYQIHEEIVRVPLLIRGPGVPAERRTGLVSTIDIAPTVLRFAGANVPSALGGVDLIHHGGLDPARTVYAEAALHPWKYRALWHKDEKWVVRQRRGERKVDRRLFYDLYADPDERNAGRWSDGEAPEALLRIAGADPDPGGLPAEYRKGIKRRAPKVAPGADAATLERLRALGYVE